MADVAAKDPAKGTAETTAGKLPVDQEKARSLNDMRRVAFRERGGGRLMQ